MHDFEKRLKSVRLPKPSARLDERVFGARYELSPLPTLLPGEAVRSFKRWVWLGSIAALPNYRIFFSLPPFSDVALYVTSRRVLIVVHVLRLVTVEVSQWFQGEADAADHDIIREARTGRSFLGFPFLEVVSQNPKKCWRRWSPQQRLRLYVRDPQSIHRLISPADS